MLEEAEAACLGILVQFIYKMQQCLKLRLHEQQYYRTFFIFLLGLYFLEISNCDLVDLEAMRYHGNNVHKHKLSQDQTSLPCVGGVVGVPTCM